MKQIVRIMVTGAASSALCGCAVMDSIHWSYPGPGDTRVITVDAKQRHLIMSKDADGQVRTCAEAAPETFGAYSSSFAGLLGIGATERNAQASSAQGETVATIEHTQTVNLLRDSMYRTCERWLSGALDKEQFLTLAARDHRSMVAVLAIEQLTGVVKPPSTIISGPAVRAMASHSEKLFEILEVYQKQRTAADQAETDSKSAYASADVPISPTAGGAAVSPCSISPPPTTEPDASKHKTCTIAKAKSEAATKVADAARVRETAVLKDLGELASGLSAGTGAGTNNPGGLSGGVSRPDPVTIAAVGFTVEKIALTAGIDEALIFCISYLASKTAELGTRQTCNTILSNRAIADELIKASRFSTNLTAADLQIVRIQVTDYSQFRARMGMLISATPDSDWTTIWASFVNQTPTNPNLCPTRADCLKFFTQGYPLTAEFKQPQPFIAAMDNWTTALIAKGITP